MPAASSHLAAGGDPSTGNARLLQSEVVAKMGDEREKEVSCDQAGSRCF